MRTTVRLAFTLQRFELVAALLAALGLAGAALLVAAELNGMTLTRACLLGAAAATGGDCDSALRSFNAVNESQAGPVMAAMAFLPLAAGLLLGVPLVGREIEQHTLATAWSLTGARRRWLLARVVPLLLVLGVLLAVSGWAASELEHARVPGLDPAASFGDFALRGWIVVARGALAFGVGLLAGALLGRVLPALIVGGAIVVACALLSGAGMQVWLSGQTVVAPATPPALTGDIYQGQRVRDAQGDLHPIEDYFVRGTPDLEIPAGASLVALVIPGERYQTAELLEAVATASGAAVALGAALMVVQRRRPT